MPLFLLSLLAASRPFISAAAFPSLNGFHTAAMVICAALCLRRADRQRIRRFAVPLLACLTALSLCALVSPHASANFSRMYMYPAGLLLCACAAALEPQKRATVVFALLAGGAVICILAFYQYLFGFIRLGEYLSTVRSPSPFALDFIGARRVFTPFVTPDILGGYLAMLIPLALVRPHGRFLAPALGAALLLTRSVGAAASLFPGLLYFYWADGKPVGKKKIAAMACVFAALCCIVGMRLAAHQPGHRGLANSVSMRLDYWKETSAVIARNPLTGSGAANFNLTRSRYSHNSYLQLAAETGIIGFAALALFVSTVVLGTRASGKRSKSETAALAAVMIFLFHNLVDFSFFLPETAFVWWMLLGMSVPADVSAKSPT